MNRAVLRRVQALLAKRGAGGVTPQEVAAALGRAARLMEREGITEEMLQTEEDGEKVQPFLLYSQGKRRGERWRAMLAQILATANGCSCFVVQGSDRIGIVGRPSDVQVVQALFAWACAEVDRLAQGWRGSGAVAVRSFRGGVVEGMHHAIEREREAARAAARAEYAGTSALVVVDRAIARRDARVQEARNWGREHVGVREDTRESRERVDPVARISGRIEGERAYGARPQGRIGE